MPSLTTAPAHGPILTPGSQASGRQAQPFKARRWLMLAALLTWPAVAGNLVAEPMRPSADATILEHLPDASDPGRRDLHKKHAELRARPNDLPLAIDVARDEMKQCGRLFDPRACGRAEAALDPWINADDPPIDVLLLRGLLRQTNHLFEAALVDLGRVLEAQPLNVQALLTRAVIHEVRAEYTLARADCGTAAFRVGQAAQVACLAAASSLTGHAVVTLAALKLADSDPGSSAEERLWALTVEAEIAARLDRTDQARDAFLRARALIPDDSYLLAAYADFLLDLGQPREVIAMLADRTRIDPLLLRLAEAEELTGAASPTHITTLAQSFETSRRRGDIVHQREQGRFELHVLHRPTDALATALANWQVQREPADARVLMEAALAAHQPMAAKSALDWFHANSVEDAALAGLVQRLELAS